MVFILMPIRVHLNIQGRVQGVCFRHYCRARAQKLGVKGIVRNNFDGSVDVIAEGEEKAVRDFIVWCRRGPPLAVVRSCEENIEAPTGEFDSFSIAF